MKLNASFTIMEIFFLLSVFSYVMAMLGSCSFLLAHMLSIPFFICLIVRVCVAFLLVDLINK